MTNYTIDLTKSEQYILSIRLSTDGFSFSIHNPSNLQEFYFQSYPVNTQRSMAANVKAFLNDTEILKYQFKETNVLLHEQRYTSVPLEIFEDEQIESIFYQNLPKRNNEIILCNILNNSNLVILFSIDKLTHLFLSEQLTNARFFSSLSPQIEYLSSHHSGDHEVYIHLHPAHIDVLCWKNSKIELINTFRTTSPNDRCYYILNIWKQLQYDQEKDKLFLTGNQDSESIQDILSDFIRHIAIINPFADYHPALEAYKDIPFDMQSLLICV